MDSSAKEMLNELSLREQLYSRITNLSINLWERKINRPDIDKWLENFDKDDDSSKCEQMHALFILSKFMYFGNRELRLLLKSIYREKVVLPIIKKIRENNNNTKSRLIIRNALNDEIESTRFLGVGNPSESGTHLLYFFRQETGLSKKSFINIHDIISIEEDDDGRPYKSLIDPTIKRYVFIDDLSGSGSQAASYLKGVVNDIKNIDKNAEVMYFSLFGTKNGIEHIRNNTQLSVVDSIFYLDDSFKCFSENSRFFKSCPDEISIDFSLEVFEKHGRKLFEYPLGYKDGQQLLGFAHNVPDNTLPAIWFDEDPSIWTPIFKRYQKVY